MYIKETKAIVTDLEILVDVEGQDYKATLERNSKQSKTQALKIARTSY